MRKEPFNKKKIENTPIPRRENSKNSKKNKAEKDSLAKEIIKENENIDRDLSKNFSKLDSNNTSEFQAVSQENYKNTENYENDKKEVSKSSRPRPSQNLVSKNKGNQRKKTIKNSPPSRENREERKKRNTHSNKSGRTAARILANPRVLVIGLVGIGVVVISVFAFLIFGGSKEKAKKKVLPIEEENVFVLDHTSSFKLKEYQLSTGNSDLRNEVASFFEENVPLENFMKAMIYKENLDGKTITPDLIPRIEAASLYNEDVMGWLRIKDSNVNIGVVQSTEGNDFYTWKGYDGKYSKHAYGTAKYYKDYGVAWAGSKRNLSGGREEMSRNTVIFGHNWENISATPRIKDDKDIMFEQVAAYVYEEFATDHPYINFSTKNDNMVFVVVAAFYTEDYWADYNKNLNFNYITADLDEKQTQTFIDEITARSHYNIEGVELGIEDKFITLSTCTRAVGRHDRQRFAVIAKLMDEKELPENIKYVTNEDYKKPAV